jgi:GNAT superfamily N-acetyltransferase
MTPMNLAPITLGRLSDRDALDVAALYESLSERSRRLRFGTPMPRIPGHVMARLCRTDGSRHVSIGARGSRGELIGVAHQVRWPGQPGSYDVALVVVDAFQGLGLGGMLLDAVVRDACARGASRLTFHLSGENRVMARLLASRGVRVRYRGGEGEAVWEPREGEERTPRGDRTRVLRTA